MSVTTELVKVLIIDDDETYVFAFKNIFDKDTYQVITANNGTDGLKLVEQEQPSVIFLDINMPGSSGLDVLTNLNKNWQDVPVIIMTGFGTMDTAIRATQLGAYDYITKPPDIEKVRLLAKRAIETMKLKKQVYELSLQVKPSSEKYELIGNSPAIQEVFKMIGNITTTPNTANVLILGESGTGKELVARAIHTRGNNAPAPFVAINCTALPETLLESELFGHNKGAFTGAVEKKIGKFELAKNGTIFLDEIGDMVPSLQQKLLRVLQEREFEPLGSNKKIAVHARFIASTNKDLEKEIKEEHFRKDLFFRLNVVKFNLPPLSSRKEDIPLLVNYFIAKYNLQLGKKINSVSKEVMDALMNYNYVGNVRELSNLIERGMIMAKGDTILSEVLPGKKNDSSQNHALNIVPNTFLLKDARKAAINEVQKKIIYENLKSTKGNVTQAAEQAGIARESFQRLLKIYNLNSKDFRTDN